MKHKHSLKEGMIVKEPTPRELDAAFSLARSLDITFEYLGQVFKNIPSIIFYEGVITNRLFDRKVNTSILYKNVTFTEFITAMVTPEKEPVTGNPDNASAQADGRAQRGEPKEVSGKKSMEDLLRELKETPIKLFTIPSWIQEQNELFDATMKHHKMLFDRDMEKYMEHVDKILSKRPVTNAKEEDRSHMSPVQRINALETEVYALKQKLAMAEKKAETKKEDRRVDFGNEFKFSDDSFGTNGPAFIGRALANDGDRCKVLIPEKGYTFKIREDYINGRPALEIHRV